MTIRQVLRLAKARGILRVLNVNLSRPYYDAALIRESIAQASVLKLSDDELREVAASKSIVVPGADILPGAFLKQRARMGFENAVELLAAGLP